ncbi:MAG: hypothetical protein KDA79_05680 [Planctomycetaceae bacterium]|nr:hypothetical protein [Planctomycetaceae bacterium]
MCCPFPVPESAAASPAQSASGTVPHGGLRRGRAASAVAGLIRRVHHDESGTVSIMTVFGIFMFGVLLAMVMNLGRAVDDKLRMQNAADAAAWTGAVTMARGMNAVAFTNHLEAEVFALTAYMREGRDRNSEQIATEVLDAWERIGPVFEERADSAGFDKFRRLGSAISGKVPLEREVVSAFGEMTAAHSELTLPVLEYILRGDSPGGAPGTPDPQGGFLPQFQRDVVRSTPAMAALAADEVAGRFAGRAQAVHQGQALQSVLWRADAVAFVEADEEFAEERTMPLVDPSPMGPDASFGGQFLSEARNEREELARHYLELWISDWMGPYFGFANGFRPGRTTAKMSNMINLWRVFTCGNLMQLLNEEYPQTNLPHMYRGNSPAYATADWQERDFTVVATACWPHLGDTFFPGLLQNPLQQSGGADAITYSQSIVYLPHWRYRCCPWLVPQYDNWGRYQGLGLNRDNWPSSWDSFNQNWTAKPVPATAQSLPTILQSQQPGVNSFRPPSLGGATIDDLINVSHH